MGRGLLNISASCLALPKWAFMSLILPLIQLLEVVGISWGNVSFACSAIMLHARCFYELLPEQHSGLDGYLLYLIHHSQFLRSSGTGLEYGKPVQPHAFTRLHGLLSPMRDFPLAFPSVGTIFSSSLWRLYRAWDTAFAASLWVTIWSQHMGLAGYPACLDLDLHPASPQLEAQSTHRSWDPLPLVHMDIFTRPCTAWASKLTRPWWVFPAAEQALEEAWLTGSWDVSDPPTALGHLEAALHSLLTSVYPLISPGIKGGD